MSDEKPVPATLQHIADKIDALARAMDARFNAVDARITQEVSDVKSQLRVEIEAVRGDVKLVYDAVIAQQDHNRSNADAHRTFTQGLDDHDVRIIALERRDRDASA